MDLARVCRSTYRVGTIDTLGSTIGGDATLGLSADSASVGGNLNALISDRGGTIHGNALLTLSIAHDFTIQGDADIEILNDGGTGAVTPLAGTIDGNATLQFSANNLTTNSLFVEISNDNRDLTGSGGMIGGDANIIFNIGGDLSSSQGLVVRIDNSNVGPGSGGLIGSSANITLNVSGNLTEQTNATFQIQNSNRGTIGSDATINVSAANISTGGNLDGEIDNFSSGSITESANLNFNVAGNLTSQGDATFQILNNDGGHIGNSANISVTTGGDLTANSIFAFVSNRNGGGIGSAANMSFNIGGALSTTGDATFAISNRNDESGGGTIGGDVNLTLTATSISAGGFLFTDVSANRGGHIMGSAHNTVDAGGLLSGGTLDFEIENAGFDTGGGFVPGGTIDADAILSVTASGISTSGDYFNEIIANDGGGHIGGNATVNLLASSMDVATNAYFDILNGPNGEGTPAGSIGGNAAIQVNVGNMLVGGLIDAEIDNGIPPEMASVAEQSAEMPRSTSPPTTLPQILCLLRSTTRVAASALIPRVAR